jgi:hypothetical protein
VKRKFALAGLLILVVAILIFLGVFSAGGMDAFLVRSGVLRVESHVDYVALPFDELVKTSDVIIVGKVVELTPSGWNQDSGEYWAGGSQYHTIRFEVSQFIVDKIEASSQKTVEIMIGGRSIAEGNQDYSLKVGDEVIAFAGLVDLAWKGRTKSMLQISTTPSLAFFVRQNPSGEFAGVIVNRLGQTSLSLSLPEWIAKIEETLEEPNSP